MNVSLKQLLLILQDNQCAYCGDPLTRSSATIDHVTPRSRGGSNGKNNKVLTCRPCNESKADNIPTAEQRSARNRVKRAMRLYMSKHSKLKIREPNHRERQSGIRETGSFHAELHRAVRNAQRKDDAV